MPWRLIVVVVVFALFLIFITFNLENRSDISFGFAEIEQVPVFLTIFASFALGFFCTLPFILFGKKKGKGIPFLRKKPKKEETPAASGGAKMIDGDPHAPK